MDVTEIFNLPLFGVDVAARARMLGDNGVLIRKLEPYDSRYRDWADAYEWAVPTGGHGLRFKNPRLVLTLRPGTRVASSRLAQAAPSVDVAALAQSLRATGAGGAPPPVLPSPSEFARIAARHSAESLPQSSRLPRQRIRGLAPTRRGNPIPSLPPPPTRAPPQYPTL